MLTKNQKKQLKSLANQLTIRYQVGKNEITENLLNMLNKALDAHELIKIDVMQAVNDHLQEITLDLSSKLNAEVVQVIGNTIVLYRRNKGKPIIVLVK